MTGPSKKPRKPLVRHAWIARGMVPMKRSKLRDVNPVRQAKKRKRRQANHAAYMRSEARKIVERRSGGRCEFAVPVNPHVTDRGDRFEWQTNPEKWTRCGKPARPHHHGPGAYVDEPGTEDPERMVHGCRACHDLCEAIRYSHRHRRTA